MVCGIWHAIYDCHVTVSSIPEHSCRRNPCRCWCRFVPKAKSSHPLFFFLYGKVERTGVSKPSRIPKLDRFFFMACSAWREWKAKKKKERGIPLAIWKLSSGTRRHAKDKLETMNSGAWTGWKWASDPAFCTEVRLESGVDRYLLKDSAEQRFGKSLWWFYLILQIRRHPHLYGWQASQATGHVARFCPISRLLMIIST